jgi:hypothetical protein
MHKERGSVRMKEIIDKLSDVSKVETPPKFAGRRQTMVLGPDKLKIKSYLDSQLASEKAQQVEIDSQKEDLDS